LKVSLKSAILKADFASLKVANLKVAFGSTATKTRFLMQKLIAGLDLRHLKFLADLYYHFATKHALLVNLVCHRLKFLGILDCQNRS